jgi:nucleotide-binding universal stress UspA family protein
MFIETSSTIAPKRVKAESPPVVVGYDGSHEARNALEVAAERAGPGGKVVVVFVAPATAQWLDSSLYDSAVAQRRRREQEILDELADVDLGDVTIEIELVDGRPAEALVREARTRDALEIVLGSRGLGPIRAALGSVSHEVVRRADRPVVVVPPAAADGDGASDGDH